MLTSCAKPTEVTHERPRRSISIMQGSDDMRLKEHVYRARRQRQAVASVYSKADRNMLSLLLSIPGHEQI